MDRRRPIFNATLRAAAGWLFLRVARSLRINPDMLVARALKNSQLTCGHMPATYETMDQCNPRAHGICHARVQIPNRISSLG